MHSKNSIIIDTGFFLALADRSDPLHKKAKQLGNQYSDWQWMTTLPVITELCHMLPKKFAIQLLKDQQRGLFSVYSFCDTDYSRVIELMQKYQEHDIDLADISLIILAERVDHGDVLSCDERDFSMLRWKNNKHFNNAFFAPIG